MVNYSSDRSFVVDYRSDYFVIDFRTEALSCVADYRSDTFVMDYRTEALSCVVDYWI